MPSKLEKKFIDLWIDHYPQIYLEREVMLVPNRRFRFDFVHRKSKIAIEINGAIWVQGRHSRGSGLVKEYEKLNFATMHGYRVFILSSEMINLKWIDRIAQTIN